MAIWLPNYAPADDGGGSVIDPETSPFDGEMEIEDVAEEAGPSKEQLLKDFEEMKKTNEELKGRADQSATLSQSFNSFGERLEKSFQRPVQQAPAAPVPGESLDEFKERINRKYLEDPYGTMVEFSNRYVGSALSSVAQQSLKLQRKIAFMESPDKEFISKHQDEIDGEIARIPVEQQMQDPDSVKRVLDTVRARYMDEIINQKVAEKLAAAGIGPGAASPRAPLGSSESPLTPAAPPSTSGTSSSSKKIQVTPAKRDRIVSQMSREGIPQDKYADYVRWLVEDGEFDRV